MTGLIRQLKKTKLVDKAGANHLLLTRREKEVMQHFAKGDSVKDIAKQLQMKDATVYAHRINILKKLK